MSPKTNCYNFFKLLCVRKLCKPLIENPGRLRRFNARHFVSWNSLNVLYQPQRWLFVHNIFARHRLTRKPVGDISMVNVRKLFVWNWLEVCRNAGCFNCKCWLVVPINIPVTFCSAIPFSHFCFHNADELSLTEVLFISQNK